jgi:hypothetical protein
MSTVNRLVRLWVALVLIASGRAGYAVDACNLKNVPSCAEAGKVVKFSVKVTEAGNTPIFGATIDVGTTDAGTTNSNGIRDVGYTCGAAGSSVIVTATRNGETEPCASSTLQCYPKDKMGSYIQNAVAMATPGIHSYDETDLVSSSFVLTFLGSEFAGPSPATLDVSVDVEETAPASGVFLAAITSYVASYPVFSVGPFDFGTTTVSLNTNGSNFLTIDTNSTEVFGAMQTKIENDLIGLDTTRHMTLEGNLAADQLTLDVAGFLISPVQPKIVPAAPPIVVGVLAVVLCGAGVLLMRRRRSA